jgi:hypothetical protein
MLGSWLRIDSGYLASKRPIVSPTGVVGTIRVNIIGPSETASWYSDVITKIQTARSTWWPSTTLTITQNNNSAYAGADISRANFDVVMIWTDAGYSNTALGTALNNFVAAGGGLCVAVFAVASVSLPATFNYTNTPVVYPGNQTMSSTSLGTYTSSDPLMRGVTTFNPGSARFGAGGLTAQPGATVVAQYNDGNLLVVKKTIGSARTVGLNYFPPSSTARTDFWTASTNGGEMMCNAIVWCGYGV